MELDLLKRHWEAFGRDDPLWAVLTVPDLVGGGWDLDAFLATGEREVAETLDELARLEVPVQRGRALDFGCGVGRLTQALAERFDRCDGVDIAASMVDEARRINRHGDRVGYHVNSAPDLSLFASESFDFVLSFIVLQHMEPRYAKRYIAEFIRVLRPGGIALFQLPSGMRGGPTMELPADAFRAFLTLADATPDQLLPLKQVPVRVRVRNDSPHPWPTGARVRVGGHWRDHRGRTIMENGIRCDLAGDLAAGAERTLDLPVRAPAVPGRYRLDIDVVQEPANWFAAHGSPPLRVSLAVAGEPEAEQGASAPPALAPVMEMHNIAPADVRATVAAGGGEVLHQLPDVRAGSELEGYRYIVRRVAERTPPLPRASLSYLTDALGAVPDRPDMFPPVITRRSGRVGRLELRLRRQLGRALRSLTWVQAEYDRAVLRALRETRGALEDHDAELRALRQELERLREAGGEPPRRTE